MISLIIKSLPIILFFTLYKFYNIYYATLAMIAASALQTLFYLLKDRRFDPQSAITLVVVILLGSATLLLRNELFIKWKPTVVFWIFSIIIISAQVIWKKNFIKTLMQDNISLPEQIWNNLSYGWAVFCLLMGIINLYVAYRFDTNTWVNFKVFGTLSCTIIFGIIQSWYISKHLKN